MHVYTQVDMHVYTCVYMHAYTHVYAHAHAPVCTYVNTSVQYRHPLAMPVLMPMSDVHRLVAASGLSGIHIQPGLGAI